MKREQIKNLFTNPQKTMEDGLWFSGIEGEGEYKKWWSNGQLFTHAFYKDGEKDGEYKGWHISGKLGQHGFYENGKKEGERKEWFRDGKPYIHDFWKNGLKMVNIKAGMTMVICVCTHFLKMIKYTVNIKCGIKTVN